MTEPGPRRLQVFVSAGCDNCRHARELVDAVRRLRPLQPVEVVDLDAGAGAVPAGIIGAPTYRLGEEIFSLGNPTLDDLLVTLDAAAP